MLGSVFTGAQEHYCSACIDGARAVGVYQVGTFQGGSASLKGELISVMRDRNSSIKHQSSKNMCREATALLPACAMPR